MQSARWVRGGSGLAVLAALAAAVALGAGAGCRNKKKQGKKTVVQQVGRDWTSEWGSIRSLGAEGKFNCERGLKDFQENSSPAERSKACEQMVKGYKQVMDASNKADQLLEAARVQSPGRDFTGWEDEVAGWMELLKPVKQSLPNEYIDKLHE